MVPKSYSRYFSARISPIVIYGLSYIILHIVIMDLSWWLSDGLLKSISLKTKKIMLKIDILCEFYCVLVWSGYILPVIDKHSKDSTFPIPWGCFAATMHVHVRSAPPPRRSSCHGLHGRGWVNPKKNELEWGYPLRIYHIHIEIYIDLEWIGSTASQWHCCWHLLSRSSVTLVTPNDDERQFFNHLGIPSISPMGLSETVVPLHPLVNHQCSKILMLISRRIHVWYIYDMLTFGVYWW